MTYANKIKCPHCGRMSENLKPLREWTSQLLIVDEVSCPGCKGIFRIYHGAKKNGETIAYTIPKSQE